MAQAGYSADILYIIALAISKASVLVLLWQITPVGVHRRMALISGSLIGMWTLASIFAAVFQCSAPDTWTILSPHCFDKVWVTNLDICTRCFAIRLTPQQSSFWTAYGIINILTEVILISIPTYTICSLHMSSQRKAVAVSCFAIRVL